MATVLRVRGLGRVVVFLLVVVLPTVALGSTSAWVKDVGQADAAPPPLGWNSWNRFGCDIDEQLIRQTADALVRSGLRDAGYRYVIIDDCWMASHRDRNGRLTADPTRFPSGMATLARYVHARGLKLGLYSSAGTRTCAGYPASLDHERVDAATFAGWGVDYLKYDNCYGQGRPAPVRYQAMADALRATGRPIVLSICEWGQNAPWSGWGSEVGGSLWRTTDDIEDTWASTMAILDRQAELARYAGPRGWNDPDMLEVGNGGMSDTEYRAQVSLWALLNAPLIAGNDLRSMSAGTRALLTNPSVLAVDQDWGGHPARRVWGDVDAEVWARPLSDGSTAVVALNRSTVARPVTAATGTFRYHDLWTGEVGEVGQVGDAASLRPVVPPHGVAMYVVSPWSEDA